jgi:hypothetical protein
MEKAVCLAAADGAKDFISVAGECAEEVKTQA